MIDTRRRIKAAVRDALPAAWRVPAKYWHARASGTLEPEMQLLSHLVAEGDRVIDVGGNFGAYAYALARIGARVEVFEPNAACVRALTSWAAARALVVVHPVALSCSRGRAVLAIPVEPDGTEHDAAGTIERDTAESGAVEWGVAGPVRAETVAVDTLDAFGFRDVVLIKIDVEGHEAAVIEGALATITTSAPALLVEIEQRHRAAPITDTFARIVGLGYRGWFLRSGKLVELATFDAVVDQPRDAPGSAGYINNFLFLAEVRLRQGAYRGLLDGGAT